MMPVAIVKDMVHILDGPLPFPVAVTTPRAGTGPGLGLRPRGR